MQSSQRLELQRKKNKIAHLVVAAHQAGDMRPLSMLLRCLANQASRLALYEADSPSFFGEPLTPC